MYNVPTLSAVLWPAGILAVSIAMLKGVFPRWVAYVGIAAGVAGIIGEAAFPIVPPVFYVYGLLMLVWMIAVTGRLFALGRVSGAP